MNTDKPSDYGTRVPPALTSSIFKARSAIPIKRRKEKKKARAFSPFETSGTSEDGVTRAIRDVVSETTSQITVILFSLVVCIGCLSSTSMTSLVTAFGRRFVPPNYTVADDKKPRQPRACPAHAD